MINHIAHTKVAQLLRHLEGAYAPNTLRAYRADTLDLIAYCEQHGLDALPANPRTVSAFLLKSAERGVKSSTIRRKVSSISAIHRLSYLEDPTKHPEVRIAMRKISRQLGTRSDQAYPITRPLLEKLLTACSSDIWGLRNRALLLLAYDSMRRRTELVSLRIEDIEWHSDEGASILLRKSKTDQHGTGRWIHLCTETTTAITEWLHAADLTEGLIFRGVLSGGSLSNSLCDSRVPRIFKSLAKRAQLDERIVSDISGHSMRVGGAQDLLVQGASIPQIMVRGGWAKTETVMRYIDRVHQRTPKPY